MKISRIASVVVLALAQTAVGIALAVSPVMAQFVKQPNTNQISGYLELIASGMRGYGTSTCYGGRGYDDVTEGMSVIVKNEEGKIIAIGKTEAGIRPETDSSVRCIFDFKIDNVPKSSFYTIGIGRRGEMTFSYQEMEQRKWQITAVLSQSRK
ncbi:MAG: hypothetical protein HWQ36_25905 [Nostoc sp. NMS2]|uniref:hypothetical protein n=1 Tax=Nostoc sp. NMS2 TaxID=2815389 RepID=UPI0025D5AE5E|nr:hypothetical protein [Nostoc sp. NMS2]MBN3993822.1 hypothetical protein [Nostoc sp. NMS2]